MMYIAHRINTVQQLEAVPTEYGIEVDLRDHGDRIVLQHDPYIQPGAEDFEMLLKAYRHRLIILNVKSERIELRVRQLMQQYGIESYFFLDSSFPMIRLLSSQGENRIAVRFSEYEPLESALAVAGKVEWVWVDCFTRMPLDGKSYARLRQHFKICMVSPELQGRSVETISQFATELAPYQVDAVCTKRPDLWQQAINSIAPRGANEYRRIA